MWAMKFVGVGELCRGGDVLRASVRPAVGDVLAHGAMEQHRVLQHEADVRAQRIELVVAQIAAVDQDAAGGRIVEARNEAHHGGLAAAGRPTIPTD
jgi:hypothetical protein